MKGAFYTGKYRNVFAELGHSQDEIDKKLKEAFHTVFYGAEGEKFYFESGDDMGYFEDTGNFDARTEGMSYAMMMCVQMDMKNEFDRVWKWARTYMYMEDGYNKGYFAWSCKTDGTKNDHGPAPDGEEFFAMSLFFASHRWGDGEGIFNYSQEARNTRLWSRKTILSVLFQAASSATRRIIALTSMNCSHCGQMKKTARFGKRRQRQAVNI